MVSRKAQEGWLGWSKKWLPVPVFFSFFLMTEMIRTQNIYPVVNEMLTIWRHTCSPAVLVYSKQTEVI